MASLAKKRRPNFSSEELLALISAVRQRQAEIDGPLTSSLTHTMKIRAWEEVTSRVNAVSGTQRTVAEVKAKYIDFKSHTKKKMAVRKREQISAGRDPSSLPILTPAEVAMVQLINPEVVYGIGDYLETESEDVVIMETRDAEAIAMNADDPLAVDVPSDKPITFQSKKPQLPKVAKQPRSPVEALPVSPVAARRPRNSSSSSPPPVSPDMLEVQDGILQEVRGLCADIHNQKRALNNINQSLISSADRSSSRGPPPVAPQMLKIQEGILKEVCGLRSDLQNQKRSLDNINQTLVSLTGVIKDALMKMN